MNFNVKNIKQCLSEEDSNVIFITITIIIVNNSAFLMFRSNTHCTGQSQLSR